ncbi:hypothetical protein HAX54_041606, partial [Datura stramonium]|nr:hypothetical protein [Datura stramonium]
MSAQTARQGDRVCTQRYVLSQKMGNVLSWVVLPIKLLSTLVADSQLASAADNQSENGRPTLNLERRSDHDGHPLVITAADAVTASGVSPWNWRETPGTDGSLWLLFRCIVALFEYLLAKQYPSFEVSSSQSYEGRVISVKWGDYTHAIKEAIKSAFRLRTKRILVEDEDNIVRTLDRDMPLGNYTLHVDE